MKKDTIRTTLSLPLELLEATDQAINQGKAKNRNEFIAQALKHELAALKKAEIEVELAEMAQDPDYQAEVVRMDAEFASAIPRTEALRRAQEIIQGYTKDRSLVTELIAERRQEAKNE